MSVASDSWRNAGWGIWYRGRCEACGEFVDLRRHACDPPPIDLSEEPAIDDADIGANPVDRCPAFGFGHDDPLYSRASVSPASVFTGAPVGGWAMLGETDFRLKAKPEMSAASIRRRRAEWRASLLPLPEADEAVIEYDILDPRTFKGAAVYRTANGRKVFRSEGNAGFYFMGEFRIVLAVENSTGEGEFSLTYRMDGTPCDGFRSALSATDFRLVKQEAAS